VVESIDEVSEILAHAAAHVPGARIRKNKENGL
jgi:hypothetical protein